MELKLFDKLREHQTVRICAFGSSNTQRFDTGMHWFDYLDLGFKLTYGAELSHCFNMGISGDTSSMMLARFDRDITPYRPDLTIITCGGNDSAPSRDISEKQFADNLRELHRRLSALGSEVLFQTYYGCDLERMDPEHARNMTRYMQIVRETAAELNCPLHDNFARWNRLRLEAPEVYRLLMRDAMHVNQYGNMLIGLDLLRLFGITLPEDKRDYCRSGLIAQCALDILEKREAH